MKTGLENTESRQYEIAFLVKSEEGQKEIKKILEKCQLAIIREGKLLRIRLAFPIKKESFAYFGYFYFVADPGEIKNLNAELKIQPEILRFLITRWPLTEKEGEIDEEISAKRKGRSQEKEDRSSKDSPLRLSSKKIKVEELSNEALEKKLEEILNK